MEFKHFNNDGVDYFQLHIKCPVCLEHDIPVETTDWVHGHKSDGSTCGGDIYIGDNGAYYCEKCGQTDLICNWGYKCSHHEQQGLGLGEYVNVSDGKYIAQAISVAGQITDIGGLKWLNKLTDALLKQEFNK